MKKVGLTTRIFIGLLLGVIVGILLQDQVAIANTIQAVGDIYIRLIKMIMIPLVFSSLVLGVANVSDLAKIGRVGIKTLIIFMGTTTVAITIGLIVSSILEPGSQMNLVASQPNEGIESVSFIETIVTIVPDNFIVAVMDSNMLQIIFFALILGMGIVKSQEKGAALKDVIESVSVVIHNITSMIMELTPFGVFGLIVPVVANNGLDVLLPLSKIIVAFYIAVILQLFVTYGLLIKFGTDYSIKEFFKKIMPAQLVGFTTCSSSATLPVSLRCTQEDLKMSKDVSGFVLPLGATINMDGSALYLGITALFTAQAFGIDLTLMNQITIVLTAVLSSIGVAGIPGSGMIVLSMVLASVGLPVEAIGLIAGIDRILDMGRTLINVTGDAVTAAVIDKSEQKETQTALGTLFNFESTN
ncbi:dicarboxylate/amino acid:cation symporter [Lacticigenium naphthae]|uniref:dicarboxylate/amino acid:cation symporter n=1 Tax=Lacticigenium naphthae TaxID=515351 RepID=UPI00040BA4E4|nr:dicarboxylate/amino acid:cation symporter [Lacticigenium naphthae]